MPARLYIAGLLAEFDGVGIDGVSTETFSMGENDIIDWVIETGNTSLKNDAWFIPDICKRPSSIWQGLRRLGQETTLVYAGIPKGDFALEHGMEIGVNGDIAIPPDRLFLVFLTPDFKIAKFRFEQLNTNNPSFPIDSEGRFNSQLWPIQTSLFSS